MSKFKKLKLLKNITIVLTAMSFILVGFQPIQAQVTNPQQGSTGLSGTVPSPPPTVPATISFPGNNQVFNDVPIDVTGVCTDGLLVKVFKNGIFGGSDLCTNSTYTVTMDLFSGENELVAIVYDDLDQEGPPSNLVDVTYNDDFGLEAGFNRVGLTSNFAKRGTDPDTPLTWPINITGGVGPYALKIDWGDGLEDLLTENVAGEISISHVYKESGVYRIIIKITDSRDQSSFIQLTGIVNGPLGEIIEGIEDGSTEGIASASRVVYRWITWPLFLMIALIVLTFWIGRRYEIRKLKQLIAASRQKTY